MQPLVRIAKDAVELYIKDGRTLEVSDDGLPTELKRKGGVFVCLKIGGRLRGCIGTYNPTEPNIARETVKNAIAAATCDPRFMCVRPEELDKIEYTVDVLTSPEPVSGIEDLDPKRYGVIVQSGSRRGLLLPDIEGISSAKEQVSIAMQKAGILPGTQVKLFRFEVERYK